MLKPVKIHTKSSEHRQLGVIVLNAAIGIEELLELAILVTT